MKKPWRLRNSQGKALYGDSEVLKKYYKEQYLKENIQRVQEIDELPFMFVTIQEITAADCAKKIGDK